SHSHAVLAQFFRYLFNLFAFSSFLYFDSIFFFTDPATTEIYTLSLHDALPISSGQMTWAMHISLAPTFFDPAETPGVIAPYRRRDRKSTRLNSSHLVISYAVFCLKKKKKKKNTSFLQ